LQGISQKELSSKLSTLVKDRKKKIADRMATETVSIQQHIRGLAAKASVKFRFLSTDFKRKLNALFWKKRTITISNSIFSFFLE
jgi:hypothetical protein